MKVCFGKFAKWNICKRASLGTLLTDLSKANTNPC